MNKRKTPLQNLDQIPDLASVRLGDLTLDLSYSEDRDGEDLVSRVACAVSYRGVLVKDLRTVRVMDNALLYVWGEAYGFRPYSTKDGLALSYLVHFLEAVSNDGQIGERRQELDAAWELDRAEVKA